MSQNRWVLEDQADSEAENELDTLDYQLWIH